MKRNFISLALFLLWTVLLEAQTLSKETVVIETVYGKMHIKFYEETPLHKTNFIKLVKEKKFDSLLFHRVIYQFMIQGGDPLSKTARPGDSLGHGDLGYMIPAEFNAKLIHKKGTICAARENDDINPDKASSASQFYLVMGRKRSAEELIKYEERINKNRYVNCARAYLTTEQGRELKLKYNQFKSDSMADSAAIINTEIETRVKAEYNKQAEYKFSDYQKEIYTGIGGTPHLDGSYTVFGEVIKGIELIDKIAAEKTDKRDRPLKDIRMKVYLLNDK